MSDVMGTEEFNGKSPAKAPSTGNHRAMQTVRVLVEGTAFELVEGELIELDDATAASLVPLGYVERAKGNKAKIETPESKTPKAESR